MQLQGTGQREISKTASRGKDGTDDQINTTGLQPRAWQRQEGHVGTTVVWVGELERKALWGRGLALLGRHIQARSPTPTEYRGSTGVRGCAALPFPE